MNLTSNFDFAVELGIASVKEIFHLAFKSEDLYPHNVGPIHLTLSGQPATIYVRALDDMTDPADLSFRDEKHILFSIPFEITAELPEAPDPSLLHITMKSRAEIPGKLDTWPDGGTDVLGINFADVTPSEVGIPVIEGLPAIGISNIMAAIHARYDQVQHTYTLGENVLVVYDDARDPFLSPTNLATPNEIQGELVNAGGKTYVKLTFPIHATVPAAAFSSYGRIIVHRELKQTETTISLDMATEPAAPLDAKVEFDSGGAVASLVAAQLKPLAVNALATFGTVTQPAFTEAAARQLMQQQIAAYVQPRKYPVYSPQSGDSEVPLSTPVGFLLVSEGVLAILMNRRDGSVADFAPDNFLAGRELALAVGRARVMEVINGVIDEQFPDLKSGGQEIHTDQGDATLKKLTADLSDPGEHGESQGHVWMSGEAEVHIDCWPDPDVSFEGPIFIDTTLERTEEACILTAKGRAGEFDIDQSCCDVLLDLLIPIVGWIVLAITESTIDAVGGAMIQDIAAGQSKVLAPIPPVVNGVAQVSACLTGLEVRRDGFIFPGEIQLRRITTSFEDRMAERDQPKP
jgi:hypothetical protein